MGEMATAEILRFMQRPGGRYAGSAMFLLLGGSALCLLGNPRRTLDTDYLVEGRRTRQDEQGRDIELTARSEQPRRQQQAVAW